MPTKFHPFAHPVSHIALPRQFTCPFHYTPHPLCLLAAAEVQAYLATRDDWQEELQQGKMFGVLVVQAPSGERGYLAAFSGLLAGRNLHAFFVPPVYDLQQPQGFFQEEEENISAINREIARLENDPGYRSQQQALATARQQAQQALDHLRATLKAAKAERDRRRAAMPSEQELAALIRESQFQKAELKRQERQWKAHLDYLQAACDETAHQIGRLKEERKSRSAALQQRLFSEFRLLNARGESKDLWTIFAQTAHRTPPAGAGECAAPKLLQYAYLHGMQPVAMAEFWWGNSPKAEIRHHGTYYPACKGKCEPILNHMLQGLDVERNPLQDDPHAGSASPLSVAYEDPYLLVVNKPAGMLSVPGKGETASVYTYLKAAYPDLAELFIVHRLDMATSGLLLVAKDKATYRDLQEQFCRRSIKKRYTALLEGILPQDEGTIELPLRPDPLDRPRQVVDPAHGKPAITRYRVLQRTQEGTLVAFYPLTGRTHQLRMHAAHPKGLDCPIRGDNLYGQPADRMYLHAAALEFRHPASGATVCIEQEADFNIRTPENTAAERTFS